MTKPKTPLMPACELAVDVMIVGAGPAGIATAIALRNAGVAQVLVVDRQAVPAFVVGESATPDVAQHLRHLGLEAPLSELGHTPYYANCSLWGDSSPQFDDFMRRGLPHGWHLDRQAFNQWLRCMAVERGVALHAPASISGLTPSPVGWRATLETAAKNEPATLQPVQAKVIVDASGRSATLAKRLGVKPQRIDQLVALTVHAEPTEGALAGLSLVESFADGWWYAGNLPNGKAVVALMTDHDIARDKGFYQADHFCAAWQATAALAVRVPVPKAQSLSIHACAAHSSYLQRAAGANWLAVGDALLAFDPLTSSGIASALSDGIAAAKVIQGQLQGDVAPAKAWAERANRSFTRYLHERNQHYLYERRWCQHPFWARRQTAVNVAKAVPV